MKKNIFLFVILFWLYEPANAKGKNGNEIIIPPCTFTVTTTIENVACLGGTGQATATAIGGASPYTYSWIPSGGTNYTTPPLTAGTYTVNVTDINGCTGSATITITQPPYQLSTTSHIVSDTGGNCNGSAWITASGGTSPYTYLWTSGQTTDTIKNLCGGSYLCRVTDAHGCTSTVNATITGIAELETKSEAMNVYPNPNNGNFVLSLTNSNKKYCLEIYNVLGEKVYTENLPQKQNNNINLTGQPNGIYLYRVLKEGGGLAGSGKIVIDK